MIILIILLLFTLIIILLLILMFIRYFKSDNTNDLRNIYNEIILIKNGQENANNFIKRIYDDLKK